MTEFTLTPPPAPPPPDDDVEKALRKAGQAVDDANKRIDRLERDVRDLRAEADHWRAEARDAQHMRDHYRQRAEVQAARIENLYARISLIANLVCEAARTFPASKPDVESAVVAAVVDGLQRREEHVRRTLARAIEKAVQQEKNDDRKAALREAQTVVLITNVEG